MSLKGTLIGLGIALALVVVIVLVVGHWSPDEGSVAKSMSVDVGDHTVTVGGKYKDVTQESMADGMDIKVDGHDIAINADQLTVDGKTQVLEAGQDVEVFIDDNGAISVKLVQAEAGGASKAPQ